MIDCGNWILPWQLFFGDEWSEVANDWPHIAVGQLEPRTRECIGELVGVFEEAPRYLFVRRIETQREVGGQHGWCMLFGWIMRIRHSSFSRAILRRPLVCTSGTLGELPFVIEEILEEV